MAKKGLSLEEKRDKALEYFHETRGVYLMKELEKSLPKVKGITAMTVKEVVQSLVDDDLVTMEKIGTSNYFWSFPSHARKMRQMRHDQLNKERGALLDQLSQLNEKIEDEEQQRLSPDRVEKIDTFKQLKQAQQQLQEKLDMYKDFDPQVIQFKKDAILVAKEATNRWTDNVFCIQGKLTRDFGVSSADFHQMFEIDAKFDNIE